MGLVLHGGNFYFNAALYLNASRIEWLGARQS